jgi:hypothetical protein
MTKLKSPVYLCFGSGAALLFLGIGVMLIGRSTASDRVLWLGKLMWLFGICLCALPLVAGVLLKLLKR